MGSWESRAEEQKENLLEVINQQHTRPVNVLVVGRPGVGKSSLITSMECALTDTPPHEVAPAGSMEGGSSFTYKLKRYQLFEKLSNVKIGKRNINDLRHKWPVMYDMPGLLDQVAYQSILNKILQGKVKPNEDVLVERIDSMDCFTEVVEGGQHIIDRVIFVHSKTEELPENLIHVAVRECQRNDVTLFSILTHDDKAESIVSYKAFSQALGTKGTPRGFKVQLYHQGMAKHDSYSADYKTNYYMCRLLKHLLNPHYETHSPSTIA